MEEAQLNVVTGAFGYTGKYITRRLLDMGQRVKTLTGHPNRPNPFGQRVSVAPFSFDDPERLIGSLRGASTLFNTYWIRFPHGQLTFDDAIENTRALISAARQAGLGRIVHLSVTNPSAQSRLPYFRGKALIERSIMESGLSYAIMRPTVTFGPEDILINNIAWLLRRLPVFALPGRGDYRVQPVFVGDLAEMAVGLSQQNRNLVVDAAGPEILSFAQCVRLIAAAINSRAAIIHVSPYVMHLFSQLIGPLLGDVLLTRNEITGLMGNLLISHNPPTATTHLSDWLNRNASSLGRRYASELHRHYR